ncbi:MucR family transcriptional regulator [Methylobacterium sp. J-030]|uniref:MucR family transcriptional regulator n=1 Tax=Methylobacterium sp. J-030 TaxID=2836627 RepID=UPI001FB8B04B|nr:MucR family transcriptional regulator [Methylobacterium sp. J-030]MCJ2072561.1 MucR family transcriptional regulator [Methylobacterium sp. J-030]
MGLLMIPDEASAIQTDLRHAIDRFAVRVIAAYVSGNTVSPANVPLVLASVHAALTALVRPDAVATPLPDRPTPVEIRKSVQHEGITSFLDGRSYKTLKRHLKAHGLTPEQYRARYGLPNDYPMAAPGYAARRSEIARAIQFGPRPR